MLGLLVHQAQLAPGLQRAGILPERSTPKPPRAYSLPDRRDLVTHPAATTVRIQADELAYLVSNAVKYNKKGATVRLRRSQAQDFSRIFPSRWRAGKEAISAGGGAKIPVPAIRTRSQC
jgi:hypothetical protein